MSERILVVMPNWFGEVLFATPFLQALREAHPRAFLAALGVPRAHEVLASHPLLDEFFVYDEEGIHKSWMAKRTLASVLRSKKFTTGVVLRKSLSRTILLAWSNIPRRVGFDYAKSRWVLTDRVNEPTGLHHKAKLYLQLLSALDTPAPARVEYSYYPTDEERRQADGMLRELGLPADRPRVALHPGANWEHKRWPVERFAELGNRLASARHASIIVTGSPDDRELVDAVVSRLTAPAYRLAGKTSLRQMGACLDRMSLFVSNDTGVLHIACALKRPVVALYGPTSPALTGPVGDPSKTAVLHHPECCPKIPCLSPSHPPHAGMSSISVDEAYAAAVKLLDAA